MRVVQRPNGPPSTRRQTECWARRGRSSAHFERDRLARSDLEPGLRALPEHHAGGHTRIGIGADDRDAEAPPAKNFRGAIAVDADQIGHHVRGALAASIDQKATNLQGEVTLAYRLRAAQLKTPPAEPVMTAQEKEASTLLVERVPTEGGRGFGGRGNQGPQTPEQQAVQAALQKIPQHMRSEFNILEGQKKTALDIRDFVAGEFDPLPVGDVVAYLRAQEKAGQVKLTMQGSMAQPKAGTPAGKGS